MERLLSGGDLLLHEQRPQQGRRHAHSPASRAALYEARSTLSGSAHNLFKDLKQGLAGEDVREGLTCVLSIKHPDPSFDSQTKSKLVSSEVKGIVEGAVADKLGQVFEENPFVARKHDRQGRRRRQGARGGPQRRAR